MYYLEEFVNLEEIRNLNLLIQKTGEKLEGNCLYQHHSDFVLHEKNKEPLRCNLHQLSRASKNILEVGFNAGHSAALYFYANPTAKLLVFDLCSHLYTKPCVEYLGSRYNIEFIRGNSIQTIKEYDPVILVDLIHVDGGHGKDAIQNDIVNCKKFSTPNTILVIDDAYLLSIENMINHYLESNMIQEVDYKEMGLNVTKFHRIFRYNH